MGAAQNAHAVGMTRRPDVCMATQQSQHARRQSTSSGSQQSIMGSILGGNLVC